MANYGANRKTDDLINSLKGKKPVKVLFVCLGNE